MNRDGSTGGDRLPDDTRGVTETLSFVLLIGIVITATAVLLVYGSAAVDDSKQTVEVSQAEQSLTQFDSRASQVALGKSPSQQVDLGVGDTDGSLDTQHESGWMRVRLVNASDGTTEQITNTSLGAVTYEHGETTIAYQGGGVWRRDGPGSVMVSRPEFHYRNGTLTLPIITVDGDSSVYSEVEITKNGSIIREYPNETAGWENKLRDAKVKITVHSAYYEAWGRFFETSTNALVAYDHTANTVTVKFLALPSKLHSANGIIATSGPGKIELKGTGAYLDSYNSSSGDYDATASANGTVEAAGDVNITADAKINGSVRSGGWVALKASASKINGDVYWTDGFQNDGTVTGTNASIDGVAALEPIDGLVNWRVNQISTANDNNQTEVITSENHLDISGSSGELDPGTYYLEMLDLTGETLILNTTTGNITIAVRDSVRIAKHGNTGGNLTVKGNGTVHLFVQGKDETTCQVTGGGTRPVNLCVEKKSTVHIPGERSPQLHIFGKRNFNATITGSSGNNITFDGVIYAPAGEYGTGYTYVKQADVYGGIVTGNLTLGQYGAVHYDHALEETSFPIAPTVSRLRYLYVSVHHVNVSASQSRSPVVGAVAPAGTDQRQRGW